MIVQELSTCTNNPTRPPGERLVVGQAGQEHVTRSWQLGRIQALMVSCLHGVQKVGCPVWLSLILLLQEPAEQQLETAADAAQHITAARQAVVGLSNLGNTCFLNSSVQLLLACAPLQQLVLQKDGDITRGPLGFALQQAALHAAGRCLGRRARA